jgi:hypothetical protein
MGDSRQNGRDMRLDFQLRNEIFHQGNGTSFGCVGAGTPGRYDAAYLSRNGLSHQQQLDRIGNRFDKAKEAYEASGHNIYLKIQNDLRRVAERNLNADLRHFRLSNGI